MTNNTGLPHTDPFPSKLQMLVLTSLFPLLHLCHEYGFVHTFRYPEYQIISNYSTCYGVTTSAMITNRPWMFSMSLESESTFFSSFEQRHTNMSAAVSHKPFKKIQ